MSALRAELRVKAVLESYPESEIKRAMPIVLFILANELGVDGLRPKIKTALFELLDKLGLEHELDTDTIEEAARNYVSAIDIDPQLLSDLAAVFHTLDLGPALERSNGHFALLDREPPHKMAMRYDAPVPIDSIRTTQFVHMRTGRIVA